MSRYDIFEKFYEYRFISKCYTLNVGWNFAIAAKECEKLLDPRSIKDCTNTEIWMEKTTELVYMIEKTWYKQEIIVYIDLTI